MGTKVTFTHNGKVICTYLPFLDIAEIRETIALLAYEKGLLENEKTKIRGVL
ncbi:MAG: hypothetical protein ACNYVW_00410 [Methanosarcinales archaeon]